jgi:hypothetical protein
MGTDAAVVFCDPKSKPQNPKPSPPCPPAGLCDLWVKIRFLTQSAFVYFVCFVGNLPSLQGRLRSTRKSERRRLGSVAFARAL